MEMKHFRYYYKSTVFQPVLGRRLVYKFGPKAKDWVPKNPNFERLDEIFKVESQ